MPSVSYTFKVTIDPCATTLSPNVKPTSFTYTIGGATLTGGSYSFTQTPNCKYGENVELTNLPSFVTHRVFNKNFVIQKTENRDLVGTYVVTMRGYITQPDDYTMLTSTIKEVSYDFNVEMKDPCLTTTLDSFTVANMETSVYGTADV